VVELLKLTNEQIALAFRVPLRVRLCASFMISGTSQPLNCRSKCSLENRLAFRFGRESGIRQTAETVEQLQQQNAQLKTELAAERAQRVFDMEQRGGALDRASRELLQARLEIAVVKRDAALAAGPSPSAAVH
jgi:hypothetical protein